MTMTDPDRPLERADWRACAICASALDGQRTPDGIRYAHPFGRGEDHPAVPVPVDEVQVDARCDFCSVAVPPHRRWVVPCDDFVMFDRGHPACPSGQGSSGPWAACPDCADLVRRARWSQLVTQAVRQRPADPQVRAMFADVYRRLAAHITGPPIPVDPYDRPPR